MATGTDYETDSLNYDNLIAGDQKKLVTIPGTVEVGESFSRGALLGLLTSTGLWKEAEYSEKSSYSDVGIATEDIDTTSGVQGVTDIFVEGEFANGGITLFYGDTLTEWQTYLEGQHSIYLRATISSAGVSV